MLEQRHRLQEFPALSILGFPQHCQNIPQAGESCQESALTVGIVYTHTKKKDDTDSTGDAEE